MAEKVYLKTLGTPSGFVGIASDEKFILRLILPCKEESVVADMLRKEFPEGQFRDFPRSGILKEIKDYFNGISSDLDFPVKLSHMTDFEQNVLKIVSKISYGSTMTYGEIALKAGKPKAARAIGRIVGKNPAPLIIPCHRVIGSNRKLTGFSSPGGLKQKRELLEYEGHEFEGKSIESLIKLKEKKRLK